MRAAALLARQRAGDDALAAIEQIAEFERLQQIGVVGARVVVDGDALVALLQVEQDPVHLAQALLVAHHRCLVEHLLLQGGADLSGLLDRAGRLAQQPLDLVAREGVGIGRQRRPVGGLDELGGVAARAAPEDDEVDERVGAEPVGAVDRDAGALAGRVEAGQDALGVDEDTPVDIGWQAAHRVVGGRLNRRQLLRRVDAEVDADELGDVGQLGFLHLARDMGQVEVDVVLVRTGAPTLLDLLVDEAGDHVARGEVGQRRRVALGKGLAIAIAQDAALAASRLREEDTQLVDAGRVELEHLHVFERDAAPPGDRRAVAGQRQRVRGHREDAPEAAAGEDDRLGVEGVDLAGADRDRDDAADLTVVDQQIEHLEFVEEVDVVLDALLVERLQDHVAGAVGGVARAHYRTLAVVARVPAEAALGDLAVGRAAEGQTPVLELDDRVDRLARQDLGRVLIRQVVPALDRVEHVPFPVILFQVAERGADAALGRPGVRPGGIELRDHRHVGDARELHRGHQPGATRADDDHVMLVIEAGTRIGSHGSPPQQPLDAASSLTV